MRTAFVLVVSTLALVAGAAGQVYPGDVIGVYEAGRVFKVDSQGNARSVQIGISGLWGCTMDVDNETLLVTQWGPGTILRLDTDLNVLGTLSVSPLSPNQIVIDHNGDYYFAEDTKVGGIVKLDRQGSLSTVVAWGDRALKGGLALDIDTADLLVTRSRGRVDFERVFQVSRDGSRVNSFRRGVNSIFSLVQTMDGDVWVGSCCANDSIPRVLHRIVHGETIAYAHETGPVGGISGMFCLAADRASAPRQRFLVGAYQNAGLWFYEPLSHAVTRIAAIPASFYQVTFHRNRNVCSSRVAPKKWTIGLSFPGEAGRTFVAALSATGVRPAIPLPDGRRLWFVPDHLTRLSLEGSLTPILTGNIGILDARGRATARLDLGTLPAALNGTLFWITAVTLDPAAPLGVATIADPMVFRIEGL